jgi:hypothetical protein
MDSRGGCCALLSLYSRSRQTAVTYARSTFLFRYFICYHDKLARRSRCESTYHWMVRSLFRFRKFSGRTQIWQDLACSSNWKAICFYQVKHVTARAQARMHVKSKSAQPLKFMGTVNVFLQVRRYHW